MKTKIRKTRYERIDEEVEITIPDKKLFYFITGCRISYSVKPVWTSWNVERYNKPEEIYAYDIIAVGRSFENRIERAQINVSSLPEIILKGDKHPYFRLIDTMLNYPDENVRTEEQFLFDYNAVLEAIKESL